MKLSFYINFILNLENSPILTKEESLGVDNLDEAVLILDDIKDRSEKRDGKLCRYLEVGIEEAEKQAQTFKKDAYTAIRTACFNRKIRTDKRNMASVILDSLLKDIQKGETIDTELQNTTKITEQSLNKYKEMIRLFTGGHIKWSFQLGWLLSNVDPEYRNDVVKIAEYIGMLRQIRDDINDYQENHHEPLGDLIQSKKRLPELLFLLTGDSQKQEMLRTLLVEPIENLEEIKESIFNNKVNREIASIISEIKENIFNTLPKLPEHYSIALRELTNKFI